MGKHIQALLRSVHLFWVERLPTTDSPHIAMRDRLWEFSVFEKAWNVYDTS